MAKLTYRPEIFDAPDLARAKAIIATPTSTLDTETRWQRETPYLAAKLAEELGITEGHLVIDYGCGVGRLSKALIELCGCRVLGVDISQRMRALAPDYVGSAAFSVVSRAVLQAMAAAGLRGDVAISAWVLQHCVRPSEDIALLNTALKPSAPIGVVNSKFRLVPAVETTWAGDNLDVGELLAAAFGPGVEAPLDGDVVGADIAGESWFRTYRIPGRPEPA